MQGRCVKAQSEEVNVTVKIVGIGESRSITSRKDYCVVHRVAEALVGMKQDAYC